MSSEDDFMLEDDMSDVEFDDSMDEEFSDVDDFGAVIAEKDKLKPYEVEHKSLSVDDIRKAQTAQVQQVSGVLGLPDEQVATLLRHFKWNREKLLERYMDDPDGVAKAAGITTEDSAPPKLEVVPGFMCDICCNDDEGMDTYALPCQHRFCKDCYEYYLTQKIKDEGESRKIQCPGEKCNVVIDEKTVKLIVRDDVYQRYVTLLDRTYVDDNEHIKWCPAPNCENAVECAASMKQLQTVVPTVTCAAGHEFCFGCSLADHQPCMCTLVKRWLKKCEDDSETANWLSANTKECLKCQSTIEKNGGCNHMTCRKCKYEFCWVCMGPWAEHGTSWYNCNRYEEKTSINARDAQAKSRASLERYLHYYNRFANHEQSAKLDRELYNRTEKKMAQLQANSELSWIEVQFLKAAVDVLVQARQTLKWTYAFAFYLQRNNVTEIFEDNQRDLEMAVENLSHLCEQPIDPKELSTLKQNILDKTVYVNTRKEVLLSDTAKGLKEERWTYNVEV
ncbi:hypothetical protein YB2330_001886 [Saitoella coloradoensis]